jgi:hypothetical protein
MSAPSSYEFLLSVLRQKTVDEAKEKRDIREETLWLITVITVSRAGRIKDEKKIKERMTRKRRSVSRQTDTCAARNKSTRSLLLLRIAICVMLLTAWWCDNLRHHDKYLQRSRVRYSFNVLFTGYCNFLTWQSFVRSFVSTLQHCCPV